MIGRGDLTYEVGSRVITKGDLAEILQLIRGLANKRELEQTGQRDLVQRQSFSLSNNSSATRQGEFNSLSLSLPHYQASAIIARIL